MKLARRLFPLLCNLILLNAALAAPKTDLERVTPVPADQPIPVVDFFRPPMMSEPKINLAGTHIAALVTGGSDKVQGLVYDLKTQKSDLIGGDANFDVSDFNWLGNQRLIHSLSSRGEAVIGIIATNLDQLNRSYPISQFENEIILAIPKDDRVHPLIWSRYDGMEGGKQLGVARVETETSKGAIVNLASINSSSGDGQVTKENNDRHVKKRYPRPGDDFVTSYFPDQQGQLDFAVTMAKGVSTLHHLNGETWQNCPVDLELVSIVGAGPKSGDLAVVGPRNTGKPRPLQLMNGVNGQFGETLIEDKEYDFNGYLYRDPASNVIVGAVYNRAGPRTVWFDPNYAKLQDILTGFFPGVIARIVGNNEKGDLLLVNTFSDRQPPAYHLVDLNTKKVGLIKNSAPWIDPQRMQPMNMVKFKTRDGHRLDAYVTMPAGASKQNPPPLVVLPHDGALSRDTWGYNREAQFLASRGYAVLQPNYRGSAGYSWMFPESDDWDYAKMGDDVTDATKMLISSGLVDGKRVAIMGTSFGGYLALQSATSEPDLYRCVAAVNGIFDWEQYVDDDKIERYRFPDYDHWIRKLGDPDKEKARYEAMSPLRRVDRLHIPVFMAVGHEESQAIIAQTKGLLSRVEKNNLPHEMLTLGEVGSSLVYVKNRVEVYTQIEAFLAKNLK